MSTPPTQRQRQVTSEATPDATRETTRYGTRWDQYGACRLCWAGPGKPCLDTRGFTTGKPHRPISKPHYGYRRLVYRTYRGKKIPQ